MNGCSIISLTYNFDYDQFDKPDLQNRAKNTLGEFLSFVRSSFDALVENGRVLQDFYYDCLHECPNGKKVFEEWLLSDDFGASRYLARSAMEIYLWFEKLSPKVQRLVRQNVQNWSVSALRQLTKVSTDLVKELVRDGKKTAAQVKEEGGKRTEESVREGEGGNFNIPPLLQTELAPGMRIVVTGDSNGWNGHKGIIISQNGDAWWVLLDHAVAQGLNTKQLLKPSQIELEGKDNKTNSKEIFTAVQVEKKIKEALVQRDKEKADEEQGRFAEIRDAALRQAAVELQQAQQVAQQVMQEKEELVQQLLEKERELENNRSLITRNQQLEQRAAELQKALENANKNSLGNTFNNQAAKVVNLELEKTIVPLASEVERFNSTLLLKEQELAQLKAINEKQQEEIKILYQSEVYKPDIKAREEEIIATFGEIGEHAGWNGWSRRGYRTTSGTLHTGINALAAFISDLTQEYNFSYKPDLG